MDMTCLTGTLGASDSLPVLPTCFLTTIFSKSNGASISGQLSVSEVTTHLLKQLSNLTAYELLATLFYHYNTIEREMSKGIC